MIKYHTKVFLLSTLAVIFTSNKGMNVKDLANKKNILPEINTFESSFEVVLITSEGVVKDGPFKDCAFKQLVYPFATKKYWAKCFIKGCPKSFGSETEDLSKAALMYHLCEHLRNDCFCVLAGKPMFIGCKDPIFSVTIDELPTVLLCKGSEGLYYSYRCNNCETVYAYTQQESKLQNEWKRHSLSCYGPMITKILAKNEHKLTKKCCKDASYFPHHVLGVHALYLKQKVIGIDGECNSKLS